jgi:hypothetical protein
LDDAEEVLGRRVGMGGDAAVEPADGAGGGFLDAGVVGGGGGDYVVELHDDVRADGVLERDGMFWGEEPGGGCCVNLVALPGALGALGWVRDLVLRTWAFCRVGSGSGRLPL